MLRRGLSAKGRGFTLMEVVTVTVISAILILVVIGWVISLVVTDSNSVAQAANVTNASYVTSRLSADLDGAVGCSAYGLDVPFYSFSPTEIAFYAKVGTSSTTLTAPSEGTAATLSATASAGDTSVTVSSVANLVINQNIIIGSQSGVNDAVVVSSITPSSDTITFSPALGNNYPSGTTVLAPTGTLALASTAGVTPGTQVVVGAGAAQESATVSYLIGSTAYLVQPMTYDHPSGTSVTFTGTTDLVMWQVSGGLLQRAVVAGVSGSCSPSNFATGVDDPAWVTMASGVECQLTTTSGENCITGDPSDPIFFQPYSNGVLQGGGSIGAPLSCSGTGASSCYFNSVTFSADLVDAGSSGSTLKFSQSFPVNLGASRLG